MLIIILSVSDFSSSQQSESPVKFGLHEGWALLPMLFRYELCYKICQNWYICELVTEILAQSRTDLTTSQKHANCSKLDGNINTLISHCRQLINFKTRIPSVTRNLITQHHFAANLPAPLSCSPTTTITLTIKFMFFH
jgi:hypothetical protein